MATKGEAIILCLTLAFAAVATSASPATTCSPASRA